MSGNPSSPDARRALKLATWLAALGGVALIAGIVAMGVVMAGQMTNGGMMIGGLGSQEPVTATGDYTVEIRNFDYLPRDLTIKAGARVTWINRDGAPHSATDEEAEIWDTGLLNKDQSATLAFDTPGAFKYYCFIHPDMKALLTVTP